MVNTLTTRMGEVFDRAWNLLKALSQEDLQHAARAGGLRMTPERMGAYRQAFEEQGISPTSAQLNPAESLILPDRRGNQSNANALIAAQKLNQRLGMQPAETLPFMPYDYSHPLHTDAMDALPEYEDDIPMSQIRDNEDRTWTPHGRWAGQMVENVPTYDPEGLARIEQPRFPQTIPARPPTPPPQPRRDVFKPIQSSPKVQVRPRRGGGPNSKRNRMMQRRGSQYHSR